MRDKLKAKLSNLKGFTLAELLVVVAIIAILVATSIPIFTGSMENAEKQTDEANVRAAKAAASVMILEDSSNQTPAYWYYDANKGVLVNEENTERVAAIEPYGKSQANKDGIIRLYINQTGIQDPIVWTKKS